MEPEDARRLWAASGAMSLTGDAAGDGLVAPALVVERIAALGEPVGVDALAALGERAATAGFGRQGAISCGGGTRFVEAVDGWIAVSLARPEDYEAVPAWLERPLPLGDVWEGVAEVAARLPAAELVARGRLLSLPVARLGEAVEQPRDRVVARATGEAPPLATRPCVVDLSSLWAGPLCAQLLGLHGARVIKVESTGRPDGARSGPPAFFDLLHAGHECVALDLADPAGVQALRRLIAAADVVIEASRPRALEQLGIAPAPTGERGPRVWVSITGHGREGEAGHAVAFGDDAAVAGGLVAWGSDGAPRFVADAVADPLTGMVAASAVLDALLSGGCWLLDIAMAQVAASVVEGVEPRPWHDGAPGEAAPPRTRVPTGRAGPLGADTDEVLRGLGLAHAD